MCWFLLAAAALGSLWQASCWGGQGKLRLLRACNATAAAAAGAGVRLPCCTAGGPALPGLKPTCRGRLPVAYLQAKKEKVKVRSG